MECPSKHADPSELLIGFVEGSLDSGLQRAFASHLERCHQCRELVALQRELWATLDSWSPIPVSAEFDQRVYQRVAVEQQRVARSWWRASWKPAMPLAAACLALLAVFLWNRQGPDTMETVAMEPHGPQIEQVESALQDIEMLKQIGM